MAGGTGIAALGVDADVVAIRFISADVTTTFDEFNESKLKLDSLHSLSSLKVPPPPMCSVDRGWPASVDGGLCCEFAAVTDDGDDDAGEAEPSLYVLLDLMLYFFGNGGGDVSRSLHVPLSIVSLLALGEHWPLAIM